MPSTSRSTAGWPKVHRTTSQFTTSSVAAPMRPPDQAVVVADDRVLHGVGDRQQHDEVERVQLRQFALAGEPEADDQEDVDEDRAGGSSRAIEMPGSIRSVQSLAIHARFSSDERLSFGRRQFGS